MREKIEEAVRKALTDMGAGDTPPAGGFVVERPRHLEHGDYSTNAALVTKLDPHTLAEHLKVEGVKKVEVVGKFVNFFLSREALVPQQKPLPQLYRGKRAMVEYTDPNPFKEFHIGHLMTNVIGESIARLLEATGAKVSRANYQGDVGVHVAKAIWGKMHPPAGGPELSWGEAYAYGAAQYESNKGEIDALNKKIYEKSDAEINKLYDAGRKQSLEHFEELYKKLGTKFDFYFFESESGPAGLKLVEKHADIFEKSEGAVVFRGEHTRVFVNSQGLPTYEAKELGLVELKKQKGDFDLSLTVTANETRDFFKVVRQAAEKIFPDLEGKMVVLFHGMMKFASGKMSSRTGNVVTGESLLEELAKKARGREDVAVGAIKYAVLKQSSNKDIVFDPEQSLSLEGDSGPYLQYALVRARSLTRMGKEAGIEPGTEDMPAEASVLERVLVHYPDALARAARELEPHYLTTYLTELSSAFNNWYAHNRVIGGTHPRYGMWLAYATVKTLHEGLETLGIPQPEEM